MNRLELYHYLMTMLLCFIAIKRETFPHNISILIKACQHAIHSIQNDLVPFYFRPPSCLSKNLLFIPNISANFNWIVKIPEIVQIYDLVWAPFYYAVNLEIIKVGVRMRHPELLGAHSSLLRPQPQIKLVFFISLRESSPIVQMITNNISRTRLWHHPGANLA